MEMLFGIVIIIIVLILVYVVLENRKLNSKNAAEQTMMMIQQQLAQMRETLALQLDYIRRQVVDSGTSLNERLTSASTIFGEIQKEIGGLHRASEHILAVGNNISSLQEILQSPKLRGGLGEFLLGQIIQQILPAQNFSEQYRFANGDIVDAVIRVSDRLLPIDAKFPLDNFRRLLEAQHDDERESARKAFIIDVKKHIADIADKYIMPDQGTFSFAFMYIPAENVYYELIAHQDTYNNVFETACSKNIFLVGPSTLSAHLQIIALGLKGLVIEQNARVILDRMDQLKNDIDRFADDFTVLGKHLGNMHAKYDDAERKLGRLTDKVRDIEKT